MVLYHRLKWSNADYQTLFVWIIRAAHRSKFKCMQFVLWMVYIYTYRQGRWELRHWKRVLDLGHSTGPRWSASVPRLKEGTLAFPQVPGIGSLRTPNITASNLTNGEGGSSWGYIQYYGTLWKVWKGDRFATGMQKWDPPCHVLVKKKEHCWNNACCSMYER